LAPAVRVQKMHTVDHRYPETPGSPCAMVLRLIPRSPRRRIRLATVVGGLMACPPGWARKNLRQLDTSNGCQDHTALPYAATSAKTLRRTVCDPPDSARGVSTPFVRAPVHRSQAKPALRCRFAPDAAASTASRSRVRDDRDTPLSGTGPKRYSAESGSRSSIISGNRKLGECCGTRQAFALPFFGFALSARKALTPLMKGCMRR
jgi:hypothetical protein